MNSKDIEFAFLELTPFWNAIKYDYKNQLTESKDGFKYKNLEITNVYWVNFLKYLRSTEELQDKLFTLDVGELPPNITDISTDEKLIQIAYLQYETERNLPNYIYMNNFLEILPDSVKEFKPTIDKIRGQFESMNDDKLHKTDTNMRTYVTTNLIERT